MLVHNSQFFHKISAKIFLVGSIITKSKIMFSVELLQFLKTHRAYSIVTNIFALKTDIPTVKLYLIGFIS